MKPRHQIRFNRKRKNVARTKKENEFEIQQTSSKASEIIRAQVQVGERELRFARALADTDTKVRQASLQSLQEWLRENASQMDQTQMDYLWKGLFYCLWMADKPGGITIVIGHIVDLADLAGWPFLTALLVCLMREWLGIDRHRVDKFYQLANTALEKCISLVLSGDGEEFLQRVTLFMSILNTNVWQVSKKCGVGLALHVLDVYIDAIMLPIFLHAKKVEATDRTLHRLYNTLLDDVLPLVGANAGCLIGITRRIHERIIDRLVSLVSNPELTFSKKLQRDFINRSSKRVFTIAADKRTLQERRKGLFDSGIRLKAFAVDCQPDDGVDEAKSGLGVDNDQSVNDAPSNLSPGNGDGDSKAQGNDDVEKNTHVPLVKRIIETDKNDAGQPAGVGSGQRERKRKPKKSSKRSAPPQLPVNEVTDPTTDDPTAAVPCSPRQDASNAPATAKRKVDNGLGRSRKRLRKSSKNDRT